MSSGDRGPDKNCVCSCPAFANGATNFRPPGWFKFADCVLLLGETADVLCLSKGDGPEGVTGVDGSGILLRLLNSIFSCSLKMTAIELELKDSIIN